MSERVVIKVLSENLEICIDCAVDKGYEGQAVRSLEPFECNNCGAIEVPTNQLIGEDEPNE
jgi:hypothetical protein